MAGVCHGGNKPLGHDNDDYDFNHFQPLYLWERQRERDGSQQRFFLLWPGPAGLTSCLDNLFPFKQTPPQSSFEQILGRSITQKQIHIDNPKSAAKVFLNKNG